MTSFPKISFGAKNFHVFPPQFRKHFPQLQRIVLVTLTRTRCCLLLRCCCDTKPKTKPPRTRFGRDVRRHFVETPKLAKKPGKVSYAHQYANLQFFCKIFGSLFLELKVIQVQSGLFLIGFGLFFKNPAYSLRK